jgi:predicted metalloprotease with PDZ domain
MVVPYTRADLIAALEATFPYDWTAFFRERIDEVRPHPPLDALERAGWRLAYRDEPTPYARLANGRRRSVDERFSLGFRASNDSIQDVLDGTPAAAAGLAPGMRIVAVNGRGYSQELLDDAVRAAKGTTAPIELLIEQAGFYRTYAVEYHGGPRYPYLARISGRPDLLSRIAHARTTNP